MTVQSIMCDVREEKMQQLKQSKENDTRYCDWLQVLF
jgi:hypothetical protein